MQDKFISIPCVFLMCTTM